MAKKNKSTQVAASAFNGRLLNYSGCGIVMLFVFVLMAGLGAAVVYGLTGFDTAKMGEPIGIVSIVVAAFFVLIGICWATIKFIKWETKHTVISNNQLKFDGNALQLLGSCFKWLFLTVITVGIYSLWLPIKVRQWRVKHTTSVAAENDAYGYPQPQVTFYTYPQN